MDENRPPIREGMEVIGRDGAPFGTVKEVRTNDFHVYRYLNTDYFIPFVAVADVENGRVRLKVPADKVGESNWAVPAIEGLPYVGTPPAAEPERNPPDASNEQS